MSMFKVIQKFVVCFIVLVFAGGSALAQRALTEIPNPDVEFQQSMLKVAEGFEITLFASDPMIAKPIAMNFDAKGRLWVTSSEVYPHVKPGETPTDKVIRLEDTDGDGVADESTVLVGGLLIPTAVLPAPEGIYVGNSTEIMLYKDDDDDGVADSERVMLSGFGTEDTHHIVHTLRHGPAGRIYFNQSIYIHSHLETPHGVKRLLAGGVWRLRPETMELDVFTRGLVNSWGHQFDRWGQSFQTDGAGGEGINYAFPGAAFKTAGEGVKRVMPGLNPGQPKHSGLEIISGRHFPDAWQGRMIACDFRGNRINTFKLEDSGSSYISRQMEDLVTTTHGAFRPIDVEMGPDGALYIADWYNPIIQHGEVDFRDERRDHVHGRIWRVTAKGRPLVKAPKVVGASVSELLELLKAPELFTRTQAKLQLKAMGAEAVSPALKKWVAAVRRDEDRLEGLWMSQSLDTLDVGLLRDLLNSKDADVRAAAVRVMAERPGQIDGVVGLLQKAVADQNPRVRLEAINTLRYVGTAQAAAVALGALDAGLDDSLDYALWLTVRALEPMWIDQVRANPTYFGSDVKRLMYAVASVGDSRAIGPLVSLWKGGAIGASDAAQALVLIGQLGGPAELQLVFDAVLERAAANQGGVAEALGGLQTAAALRKTKPGSGTERIAGLLASKDVATRAAAARLTGAWGVKSAIGELASIVGDTQTKGAVRSGAIAGLVLMRDGAANQALSQLAGPDQPMGVRVQVGVGYAQAAPQGAVGLVAKILADAKGGDDVTPLIGAYVGKRQMPALLAKALKGKKLNSEVGVAAVRRASTATFPTEALVKALQDAAGIEPINQALDAAGMAALLSEVAEKGNPAIGENIYRKTALQCTTCHAIGGAGGALGPDMTSLGASAPEDYIVDSLIEPQKKIKEGYHVVMLTLKDGSVVAGTLAGRDDKIVRVNDAAGNVVEAPVSDIASEMVSPISLMPPGLTATLRRDEFVNLVSFLGQLGKEGNYKVAANRYVRTWRYMDSSAGDRALSDIMRHKPIDHAASGDDRLPWLPVYSQVNGDLPTWNIPGWRRSSRSLFHYLQFKLDVKAAGQVGLKLNSAEGASLWVGQEAVASVGETTVLDLAAGIQTITIALDDDNRSANSLRIEVVDVDGSSAQVQVVGGK